MINPNSLVKGRVGIQRQASGLLRPCFALWKALTGPQIYGGSNWSPVCWRQTLGPQVSRYAEHALARAPCAFKSGMYPATASAEIWRPGVSLRLAVLLSPVPEAGALISSRAASALITRSLSCKWTKGDRENLTHDTSTDLGQNRHTWSFKTYIVCVNRGSNYQFWLHTFSKTLLSKCKVRSNNDVKKILS